MNADQLGQLMSAWVKSVPRFPDAACRGRTEMADVDVRSSREAIDAAVETCLGCREMQRCSDWVDSLDSDHRPAGVVAGRLVDSAAYQTAKALMAAERKPKPPKPQSRSRGPRRPARRLLVAAEAAGAVGLTVREAAAALYGSEVTLTQCELARQALQRLVRRGRLRRVDRGRAGYRGRVARYVWADLEAVAS